MIERTKLEMDGGLITRALRMAYEKDGLAGARELVLEGMTDDELRDVCEGRTRITGSTATELKLVPDHENG